MVKVNGDHVSRSANSPHSPQPSKSIRPPHNIEQNHVVPLPTLLKPSRSPTGRQIQQPLPIPPGDGVPGPPGIHGNGPHPMPGQQGQLPPIGHTPGPRQPERHLNSGPVMGMGQQHLPHPPERLPRTGGGKGGPRSEIEQKVPIDQHRGSSPNLLPKRHGTHSTSTVRTRKPRRGTGTEQSQFHGSIFT
ncbi:hypothetical protein a10_09227 [Streptomyces acidiscabies]|nr:hypothetical protein a10_09227 [Streptomyces acidiscabies]GAV40971.1 hypothetical protein Saa2_03871 [Streptomyces acidiscabies]